ncbi:MAG: lysophospholipid acyltransferase family protein [Isosphaeraceae bacterium]|nr:lysophospholipid acyltransferase family protein [Isosphaeraceae bacterium]
MATLTEPENNRPAPGRPAARRRPAQDRSALGAAWYGFVRYSTATLLAATGGLRASGTMNLPRKGGVLLICNHLSHLDVFVLGLPMPRMLNYVARSTLFVPILGFLIRSVGGFPIQREGKGTSGVKETLRRLRDGGVVTFFPEGTRSPNGELGPLKPGIAALAERARVPILPAGIAGTFEAWPRHRSVPRPHPIWVHFGRPIAPEDIAGAAPEVILALMRDRLLEAQDEARRALARLSGSSAS